MVLAENRSERRVAGNTRTCASVVTWRDLQKAMLSPTLFSHRKLEVPVGWRAILVVPARTLRSPTTGTGTELLAHREKIEVTRSGYHLSVLRCRCAVRIARTRAQFAHFPGESLTCQTRWRSELNSNCRYRF